ncbi:unnamed protein product [Symbiodinium natans]|uniref:Uncharacterized protein n=1 Tax=Symbiodinium natans TaxID=878477 RepID=A0A812PJ32_9DINO|nr:unnamed protein product [Symbiodinium natans]
MDEFTIFCTAILVMGMLLGAFATTVCIRPFMITVRVVTEDEGSERKPPKSNLGRSKAMPKAKAKSVAEAVREQPDGVFFRNRHLYEIFLDDDETVSFHRT